MTAPASVVALTLWTNFIKTLTYCKLKLHISKYVQNVEQSTEHAGLGQHQAKGLLSAEELFRNTF